MADRKAILLVLLLFSLPAAAEPFSVRRADSRIVILPFENETGEEEAGYLEAGLPESIASVFGETGFGETEADAEFSIDPHGTARIPRTRVRIFFDVRVEKWNQDLFAMRRKGDYAGIARVTRARYLVFGYFRLLPEEDITQSRRLEAELHLFDAASGRVFKTPLSSTAKSALTDARTAAAELRGHIALPVRHRIQFEGAETMVYIDEQYLGRAPLSADLPAGSYRLRLEKEGHEPVIENLQIAGPKSVRTELRAKQGQCELSVTSTPEGADVYLDITPIGKTPLVRSDLPCGTHRVRVSLAEHVDRYAGVVMRSGERPSVDLALSPGDTVKAFRDPRYAFLDFTYSDLSFYSFINALGFYGGYAYFQARTRTIENNARRQVPLLAFFQIQSMTLYHANVLEQNRLEAKASARMSKASAMAGGVMLASSVWFFYKSFDADYRETGEVGAFLRHRVETTLSGTGRRVDAGWLLRY